MLTSWAMQFSIITWHNTQTLTVFAIWKNIECSLFPWSRCYIEKKKRKKRDQVEFSGHISRFVHILIPSPSSPPLLLLFLHSEISTIYISVRSINLFPYLRATRAFTKFLWSRCQLFTFVFQSWDGSSYFVAVKTDCHLDDQLLLIQYVAHEYQRHINNIIYSTHIYLYIKRRFRGILFSNWYMTRFYIHNYRVFII